MAAGSVAAGGVFFQAEFTDIKNKRLEAFGVHVDNRARQEGNRQPRGKMAKVKRLRDRYIQQDTSQHRYSISSRRSSIGRRSSIHSAYQADFSIPAITLSQLPEGSVNEESSVSPSEAVSQQEEEEEEEEEYSETDQFFTQDLTRKTDHAEMINVSGTKFLVDFSIFSPYPDTFLGSDEMKNYYVESREQYFLERPKHVFAAVMRFYTNDEELICPPCIPKTLFESEVEFYGLLPHYQKTAVDPTQDLREYKAKSRREEILLHIEFPGYSKLATAYAIFDLAMIVVSTIILVLESVEELTNEPAFAKICWVVEVFVNIYFTVQTLLLISVYPSKKLYFSSLTNWIDIISVMPFYLRLIAKEYLNQIGGFRVLRLIRLLRILKLFRHSPGSQTMIHFLITSIPEIVLLLLMWSIGVLMFGPLIYFVEKGSDNFTSAFSGMWFCVVTIGTVGYGDTVPITEFGKVLAACYTIINLTIMTIPISIIITKFNKSMKKG